MPPCWNENRLTAKLGIDYPIIQGLLGGLSSQKLTAAVSNFGGLGSFGAHSLTPGAIKDVIAEIRSLTAKTFAMNLWVSMEDEGARTSDENAFNRSLRHWLSVSQPWERRVQSTNPIRGYDLRIKPASCWMRRYPCSASSTGSRRAKSWKSAGQNASSQLVRRPHPKRVQHFKRPAWMPSSLQVSKPGDIAVHSSAPTEDSLTGTFSLVPQIADMVNVPVIAAGGIADARGVVASLALGAEAVQMGTVFLACEESGASILHRQALRGKNAGHNALTKGFTGRLARGIHNRLLEELSQEGTAILPYPLQRSLAIPAEAAGRSDLLPLWAGQSANLSTCTVVLAFLTSLVEKVSEIAGPLIQWSAASREKQSF